nr:hypothetical protein BaRGS_032550 [Batillaria attramentaria]
MARKRFETAKVSASQLQLELSLLTEKDMTHSASSGEDGGSRQDIHSDDDEEQTSAHSNLQDNDMVPSVRIVKEIVKVFLNQLGKVAMKKQDQL